KSQSLDNKSSDLRDDLLNNIKNKYQSKKQKESHSNQIQVNLSSEKSQNLLSDLKHQYQTKKQSQSKNLQQNQEEIRYAEQKRQQKRKLLTRKAETWLENLDPSSDEGFWFEEFAASYSSKLEAAI
ncbi:MAG TPA: hypothetical protein DCF68_14800, partial [Cyanothece sp. UBA12306]|nr:hypothetical protein [Cyanothece sp. UBA12306]